MIDQLVTAMRACGDDLVAHGFRVADLAVKLGRHLGIDDTSLAHLSIAGVLHDVGKVGVEPKVLGKPGPLDHLERVQMEHHPRFGRALLHHQVHPRVVEAVYSHHERFDGLGYPRRLGGTEIPFLARILLVVDAFDAMTSDRCYQAARPAEAALDELMVYAGTQFDPEVVVAFLEAVDVEPSIVIQVA